ncbi:MAG TPA: hypothetical protein ENN74_03250 [Firmicutes bacterium]|nr:hypothetical protein [Bacillota bacterium]
MNNIPGKVKAPAIALIVVGSIGILWCLVSLVSNVLQMFGITTGGPFGSGQMSGREAEVFQTAFVAGGVAGILFSIIGIGVAIFIILAALRMLSLQSYSWCIAASILAMIPCISPCCLFGLPVGIWALVVLLSQDVKVLFAGGGVSPL